MEIVIYSPPPRSSLHDINPSVEEEEEEPSKKTFLNKSFTEPQSSHRKFFRPPPTVEDVVDEAFQKQSKVEDLLQSRSHESLDSQDNANTSDTTKSNDTKTDNSSEQKMKGFGFKRKEDRPYVEDVDDLDDSDLNHLIDDIHIISPQKSSVKSTNGESSKEKEPELKSNPVLANLGSRDQSDPFQQSKFAPSVNPSSAASAYKPACYTLFNWKYPPKITLLNDLSRLVRGSKVGK